MKKYITTDKHPELKEGLIFEADFKGDNFVKLRGLVNAAYWSEQIYDQIEKGYIKEVEEEEFTKSDMIAFSHWVHEERYTQMNGDYAILNEWIKENKAK